MSIVNGNITESVVILSGLFYCSVRIEVLRRIGKFEQKEGANFG